MHTMRRISPRQVSISYRYVISANVGPASHVFLFIGCAIHRRAFDQAFESREDERRIIVQAAAEKTSILATMTGEAPISSP
jgi:hypothetical protein